MSDKVFAMIAVVFEKGGEFEQSLLLMNRIDLAPRSRVHPRSEKDRLGLL